MSGARLTAELAEFTVGFNLADIPADVLDHAALLILDAVGCGLYGSRLPHANAVLDVLARTSAGNIATWGRRRLTLLAAVVGTAFCIDCLDFDDLHRDAILHVEPVTVAPAVVLARYVDRQVSGMELLGAVAIGAEVGVRIGLASGFHLLQRGFHAAGVGGAFCSGATASRMLGLTSAQAGQTLGTSGSLGAGLMSAQRGAQTRHLHLARSAEAGVLSALAVSEGVSGISDGIEAAYGGYLSAFGGADVSERVCADLGVRWHCVDIGFKPYAAGASTHCGIEAALALRDELASDGRSWEDISQVRIRTTSITADHAGWSFDASEGLEAARCNLPWCVGVALAEGAASPHEFTLDSLTDTKLRSIARHTVVEVDDELDRLGPPGRHATAVDIEVGGRWRSHLVERALGSLDRPLSVDDVTNKFEALCDGLLPSDDVKKLHSRIRALRQTSDVRSLVDEICQMV